MYEQYSLDTRSNATPEGFIRLFFKINASLWYRSNTGAINKDEVRNDRFAWILKQGEGDADLANDLRDYFLYHCPRQSKTIVGAESILSYLTDKYKIYIITNGFDDVQWTKLKSSGLGRFVHDMYTSESAGFRKPSPEIFEHALEETSARPHQSVMIGDNPVTDIEGAEKAGIYSVLFDPSREIDSSARLRISEFDELKKLL
jgi:putative hydrolase of the HAD superfamily